MQINITIQKNGKLVLRNTECAYYYRTVNISRNNVLHAKECDIIFLLLFYSFIYLLDFFTAGVFVLFFTKYNIYLYPYCLKTHWWKNNFMSKGHYAITFKSYYKAMTVYYISHFIDVNIYFKLIYFALIVTTA
jgi:hypothetical protein